MVTRPAVLPETYFGTKEWEKWIYHFKSVAAVNKGTDNAKLVWLKVWLIGHMQTAFHEHVPQ